MIFFKTTVTITTVIAFASAWSTQFPQFFHSLQPPPPPPTPFVPFYQQAQQQLLLSRYRPNQHQFHQPLLSWYQSPPTVSTMLPLRVLPPQDADHHQHHHHHHHHVIYYFSVEPDRVAGRNIRLDSRRPSCDGHHQPVEVPGFPPEYLPPSPPQVPQIPQIPPPTTTQPPCDDDDTVIVDNVDYYPFGKKPIVVASESVVLNRTQLPNQSPPRNVSNFILSNYLLPPNK